MVVSNNPLMLNIFSWLAETIIGGFLSLLMTVFSVILEVISMIFSQFLYHIGISLLKILNFIQSLVRKLVGLETYWWDGAKMDGELAGQDPVLRLITDPKVLEVFLAMLIIAVVVLIIAVITQLFRLEYTTEGAQNTKGKLFGKAFKALAMFLIVPIGTSMGIIIGNQLLKSLDAATNPSGSAYISGAIFTAAATEANRVEKIRVVTDYYVATNQDPLTGGSDYDRAMPSNPVRDVDGNVVADEHGTIRDAEGRRLIGVDSLTDKREGFEIIKGIIENFFGGGMYKQAVFTESGGSLRATYTYKPLALTEFLTDATEITLEFTSNRGGLAAQRADIANQIDYEFSSADGKLDYMNVTHVSAFYNLGDINFLILYAATIMALYVLFNVVFGLILRLYKVAVYFMLAPPIIALMPIYETAFIEWRKAIVGTIISAYSAVVGLNLFIMMLPVLKNIQLFDPSIGINRGPNAYTYLLIVIAGCYLLKELIANISKWIAAEDAFKSGADVSGKVMSTSSRAVVGATMAAGKGIKTLGGAGKASYGLAKNTGRLGLGLAQQASGAMKQAKGMRMLSKAQSMDRAGRDEKGRLLPGHRLREAAALRDKAADTFAKGSERRERGANRVVKARDTAAAKVKKMRSSIGDVVKSTGGVYKDMKGKYTDTKTTMLGGAGSKVRSLMGVAEGNKKFDDLQKKRGEKEKEEQFTVKTVKNLSAEKVDGNFKALMGGFNSAKKAFGKEDGGKEIAILAEAMNKVGETIGAGFERMGDELLKIYLSKDNDGVDVMAMVDSLAGSVQGKADSYKVSVNNIINTGGDKDKLDGLERADKQILQAIKDIEKNKK